MTTVEINPGVCGFVTKVTAESEDGLTVKVHAASGCESVRDMMKDLGDVFDSFEVCLKKPGDGVFYKYASEHFPVHCGCPIISGIIKAVEAECNLALKKDVSIKFV